MEKLLQSNLTKYGSLGAILVLLAMQNREITAKLLDGLANSTKAMEAVSGRLDGMEKAIDRLAASRGRGGRAAAPVASAEDGGP